MRSVYLAAPYTIGDQALNVRHSLEVADTLLPWFVPFCPLLSHFWHMISPKDYITWLRYSLDWLERCDYVLRLPGDSLGADVEVAHAQKLGIPIFYSVAELLQHDTITYKG